MNCFALNVFFLQLGLPLYVYFIILALGLVMAGLIVVAYRSYMKSPELDDDDYSFLHTNAPQQEVSTDEPLQSELEHEPDPAHVMERSQAETVMIPAPPVQEPVVSQRFSPATSDRLNPAPVERITAPLTPPMTQPTGRRSDVPVSSPLREESPREAYSPAREDAPREGYPPLREELPPTMRRPSKASKVFAPSAPLPQAPSPSRRVAEPAMPPPQTRTEAGPAQRNENSIFDSMAEVESRQRRSRRVTSAILLVAVIAAGIVGYAKVPRVREAVASLNDLVHGRTQPTPPPPAAPKLELMRPNMATAGATIIYQGEVRNISDGPLSNLYAEMSAPLAKGKLAETLLVPIREEVRKDDPQHAKTGNEAGVIEPAHLGVFRLEISADKFGNPEFKRILNASDGTEVKLEKK